MSKWYSSERRINANMSPDALRALSQRLLTKATQVEGWSYPTAGRLREAAGLCCDAARGLVSTSAALQLAADALAEAGVS